MAGDRDKEHILIQGNRLEPLDRDLYIPSAMADIGRMHDALATEMALEFLVIGDVVAMRFFHGQFWRTTWMDFLPAIRTAFWTWLKICDYSRVGKKFYGGCSNTAELSRIRWPCIAILRRRILIIPLSSSFPLMRLIQ